MTVFRLWRGNVLQWSCCSSEMKGFPDGGVAALRKGRIPKSYGTTNLIQETYWERRKRMAASAHLEAAKS